MFSHDSNFVSHDYKVLITGSDVLGGRSVEVNSLTFWERHFFNLLAEG